jgi:hypothetical protein
MLKNAFKFITGDAGQAVSQIAFALAIIFASMGIFVMIVGILTGCCATHKCHKCCSCCVSSSYLFLSILNSTDGGWSFSWLYSLFLQLSSWLLEVSPITFWNFPIVATTKMVDDFCSGNLTVKGQNLDYITDAVTDIDNKMRQTTANYMCTTNCPCPTSSSYGNWLDKWNNETQLNANNRTKTLVSSVYTPIYMIIPGGSTKTYTKFWDCYLSLKNLNQYSTYTTVSSN